VVQEIYTYANWSTINNNAKMAVEGIFFDEIPGLYDWRNYSYLTTAHDTVKGAKGLGQKLVGMLSNKDSRRDRS
jgi:Spherulation-specific family 4